MVSPLFARAFCVMMTGTGLLPYIRPLFEEHLYPRASMNFARIVLIGRSVFSNRPETIRFSIRRSDLFCHRSSLSLRNYWWGTSLSASCQVKLVNELESVLKRVDNRVVSQDGPAHTRHLICHSNNRFVPTTLFDDSVHPSTQRIIFLAAWMTTARAP